MLGPSEQAAVAAVVTSEVAKRYPGVDTFWLGDLILCAIWNYGNYPIDDREVVVCHFSGLWEWQRRAAAELHGVCPFPAPRWTDMFGCPASDPLNPAACGG
jgi:hypothetical protein